HGDRDRRGARRDIPAHAGGSAVIVKRIATPIGPSLVGAAAELAAAPAGSAQEWQLPDGTHALTGALALDVTGRTVRLRGSDAVALTFAAGGLEITADAVEAIELSIAAGAGPPATQVSPGRSPPSRPPPAPS